MTHIPVNFDEFPDKIESLPPGVYTCIVDEAEYKDTADGKGKKIVAKLRVDEENNPNNGRLVFDHLSLKFPVGLKQLMLSAGLKPGADGVNVEDLIGQTVRARTKTRLYKDKDTGEMKETPSVEEYLFDEIPI